MKPFHGMTAPPPFSIPPPCPIPTASWSWQQLRAIDCIVRWEMQPVRGSMVRTQSSVPMVWLFMRWAIQPNCLHEGAGVVPKCWSTAAGPQRARAFLWTENYQIKDLPSTGAKISQGAHTDMWHHLYLSSAAGPQRARGIFVGRELLKYRPGSPLQGPGKIPFNSSGGVRI